ncbi:MAG TPA: hypothetical protein VGF36_15835 [Rhodopila sp.]
MPTYRLLYRESEDSAARSAAITCATDREAVAIAEASIGDHDGVEVWHDDRPVALIGRTRARLKSAPVRLFQRAMRAFA